MIDKRDVFSLGGLDLVNEVIDMYEQKDKIKVLDVGCGSGYSVNYLSQQGFDATGIDASEEIIEIGSHLLLGVLRLGAHTDGEQAEVRETHALAVENQLLQMVECIHQHTDRKSVV